MPEPEVHCPGWFEEGERVEGERQREEDSRGRRQGGRGGGGRKMEEGVALGPLPVCGPRRSPTSRVALEEGKWRRREKDGGWKRTEA